MFEAPNSKLRVLLVEDDDSDVVLVSEAFKEAGNGTVELTRVSRLNQALSVLTQEKVDVVLLDLGLPDARGLETVEQTYATAPNVPIVVLTSLDDDVTAVKAVKEGVQDYVVKGRIDGNLLTRSIHYAIERKKSEKAIKKALDQKNWLLKELHHRVKNNLQIISSLLNLQAQNIADKETLQAYETSQNRINSMLLVHELLYQDRPSKVDFEEYLKKLAVNLFRAYGTDPNEIKFAIDAKAIFLEVDTAISCGLVVNEIVSNSLRHAFPNGGPGSIEMEFSISGENNKYTLIIRDDGIGLAEKDGFQKSSSLGMQLIETLVSNELNGTFEFHSNRGTEYRISFSETKQGRSQR
ncbi:response regulator [bacterium]|nr:response regulator [bacterium]